MPGVARFVYLVGERRRQNKLIFKCLIERCRLLLYSNVMPDKSEVWNSQKLRNSPFLYGIIKLYLEKQHLKVSSLNHIVPTLFGKGMSIHINAEYGLKLPIKPDQWNMVRISFQEPFDEGIYGMFFGRHCKISPVSVVLKKSRDVAAYRITDE